MDSGQKSASEATASRYDLRRETTQPNEFIRESARQTAYRLASSGVTGIFRKLTGTTDLAANALHTEAVARILPGSFPRIFTGRLLNGLATADIVQLDPLGEIHYDGKSETASVAYRFQISDEHSYGPSNHLRILSPELSDQIQDMCERHRVEHPNASPRSLLPLAYLCVINFLKGGLRQRASIDVGIGTMHARDSSVILGLSDEAISYIRDQRTNPRTPPTRLRA